MKKKTKKRFEKFSVRKIQAKFIPRNASSKCHFGINKCGTFAAMSFYCSLPLCYLIRCIDGQGAERNEWQEKPIIKYSAIKTYALYSLRLHLVGGVSFLCLAGRNAHATRAGTQGWSNAGMQRKTHAKAWCVVQASLSRVNLAL